MPRRSTALNAPEQAVADLSATPVTAVPLASTDGDAAAPLALTPLQEQQWLAATFALPQAAASITTDDFWTLAKAQYKAGRFHLAVRCLEIYIARVSTAAPPPAAGAARQPAPARHGASLAGGGGLVVGAPPAGSGAAVASRAGPHQLPVAPLHLLAHAHLSLGSLRRARECFLACTRLGADHDWQMVVQTELELGEAQRKAAGQQGARGAAAVATLHKHIEAARKAHELEQQRERLAQQQASPPTTNEATRQSAALDNEETSEEEDEDDASDEEVATAAPIASVTDDPHSTQLGAADPFLHVRSLSPSDREDVQTAGAWQSATRVPSALDMHLPQAALQ